MKPDTPDRVESLARDLRRVPQTERTSGGYEQQLGVLFELVFEAGGLQYIGDLRLLDDIREILLDSHLETTYPDALDRLEQQLTSAAIAHDNLSAILDSSVPIRDLLYGIFDRWEGLAGPLDVHFSANDEAELDALRYGDQPPVERIQAFVNRYMASVREESPELADNIQRIVDPALSAVQRVSKGRAVAALFAQRGGTLGRALRVSVDVVPGLGEDFQANSVDQTMQMAARDAIAAVFTLAQMPRARSNAHWSIDEPTTYEGASIGLAIAIGTLAALRQSGVDPYAAFTGTVAFDGRVGAVQHISAKVAAAARAVIAVPGALVVNQKKVGATWQGGCWRA